MTSFNQTGQKVNNQINAGGDVNIEHYNPTGDLNCSSVQTQMQFAEKVKSLKFKLSEAAQSNTTGDDEIFANAEHQLTKVEDQTARNKPDRKRISDHLNNVASILKGASSAVSIGKAAKELAQISMSIF